MTFWKWLLSIFGNSPATPAGSVIPVQQSPTQSGGVAAPGEPPKSTITERAKDVMLPPPGTSPVSMDQLNDNAVKYERCTIDPKELSELKEACDLIEKNEASEQLYSGLEAAVGVDRDAIAGVHYRESSCSMKGCFANGDLVVGPDAMRLGLKTTHVPKGKGPYPNVKASGVEAINDELKSKGWKKPPVGIADTLAFTERYNGLGPRNHGIDSGYNWGGTSEEDLGGYSNDGEWTRDRVETRVGVVAIMKEMRRRELSAPPIKKPVPIQPDQPAAQLYEKLRALAKSVNLDAAPVEELIAYHQQNLPTHRMRYWAVIDFSQPSKQKRFYLLDTAGMKVEQHLVAHGAGSDPNNDGVADKFSDVDGSHMSSLGIVRCSELYQSRGETRMRLDGLEESNKHVRSRAIVMHSAAYVNEATGICGRSWGCTVVDHKYLDQLVNALQGGSLMNLWRKI